KKAMRQQDYQRQNRNSSQQAQLNQFQTLADTGLYLGLSLSKGQYSGTLKSQYCDPELPGNCNEGSSANQSSTGMGLTFGVAVSSATRIELTYTKYADLSYGDTASHSDYFGSRDLRVSGGDIESNVLMGSFFYSLEDIFGNFSGGKLVPYFGFGVGLAFNTISEYTIYDDYGPDLDNRCLGTSTTPVMEYVSDGWYVYDDGIHDVGVLCDYVVDSETTYAGDTVQSLAWGVELGLTWKMQNQMYIDFYFRYNNLGNIENSGMVVNDQWIMDYYDTGEYYDQAGNDYDFLIDESDPINESDDDIMVGVEEVNDVRAFYDGKESTNLSITEFGVKFRLMF
ncbi:MAG: hypothetical protein JXR30_00015, partial [Alphaproteobacteria bacterium]|nr:hypothetical protein [Alphaproteobacteria bacterium]